MTIRRSPARERLLRELGSHITRRRKLQGPTQLADRAHVTRDTLRAPEGGSGAPQLDSLLAVLTSLGVLNTMVASVDPWRSKAGRALMDEELEGHPGGGVPLRIGGPPLVDSIRPLLSDTGLKVEIDITMFLIATGRIRAITPFD